MNIKLIFLQQKMNVKQPDLHSSKASLNSQEQIELAIQDLIQQTGTRRGRCTQVKGGGGQEKEGEGRQGQM